MIFLFFVCLVCNLPIHCLFSQQRLPKKILRASLLDLNILTQFVIKYKDDNKNKMQFANICALIFHECLIITFLLV